MNYHNLIKFEQNYILLFNQKLEVKQGFKRSANSVLILIIISVQWLILRYSNCSSNPPLSHQTVPPANFESCIGQYGQNEVI